MPTDPCPTCRHNPGEVLSPPRGPMARWVPCPDCASPQPDTAPEGDAYEQVGPLVIRIAPDGSRRVAAMALAAPVPPDAAPESWTADDVTRVVDAVLAEEDDPALARRVAAALNGAPATPDTSGLKADIMSALQGLWGDSDEARDQAIDVYNAIAPLLVNGAPATPAERAVIDAAETWADADARTHRSDEETFLDACDALVDAVARLRSERNKTDG